MKSQSRLVNIAILPTCVVNLKKEPKFFVWLSKEHENTDMMCAVISIWVNKSRGYSNSDFTFAVVLWMVPLVSIWLNKEHEYNDMTSTKISILVS